MASNKYSLAKGVEKSVINASVFGLSIVLAILAANYKELYDTPIVDILYRQLSPLLGTMTVGGLMTFVLNWLKNR